MAKFKVGDTVTQHNYNRPGKVTKVLADKGDDAVYEIEFEPTGNTPGRTDRFYQNQLKFAESINNKELTKGLHQYLEGINDTIKPEMPFEEPIKPEKNIDINPLRQPIEFENPLEIDKPKKPKDCSLKFAVKDKNGNSDIKEVSCNGIKVFEYITRDGQISLPSEYSMFSMLANFVHDKMGEKEE